MVDEQAICIECKQSFEITKGEQQWLQDKFGDSYSKPKRCKKCRLVKKGRHAVRDNMRQEEILPVMDEPSRRDHVEKRKHQRGDDDYGNW